MQSMFKFTKFLPDPTATDNLARELAPYLAPGDVLALTGHLGAGKSHFARALIVALGSQQKHLPSPTFTLIQTYDDTRMPIAHVDFYRLGDPSEADELSLEPFIEHGLSLIEWADNAPHVCPERTLRVNIEDKDSGRQITFTSEDESWEKRFGFFIPELQRPVTEKGRSQFVQDVTGKKGQVISAVSADGSFRSYWRVRDGQKSSILMDAPPPMESVESFVSVAKILRDNNIHAPEVYHADNKKGYALIEDFGDTTFGKAVKDGADMLSLYEKAVDVLLHLSPASLPSSLPTQTYEGWQDYLCLFTDWYMPHANGHATHTSDRRHFREIVKNMYKTLMQAPSSVMMGDYHCDNVMLLSPQKDLQAQKEIPGSIDDVGVLDFQDALIGPNTFDLARFIYDIRIPQPEHIRSILTERFMTPWLGTNKEEGIRQSLRVASLFHMLRLLGVFHRLAYRDGKTNFLDYLPVTWQYFLPMLENWEEAEELAEFIFKRTPTAKEVAV